MSVTSNQRKGLLHEKTLWCGKVEVIVNYKREIEL